MNLAENSNLEAELAVRYEEIFHAGQPPVYVPNQPVLVKPSIAKARNQWNQLKESIVIQHIARLDACKFPSQTTIRRSEEFVSKAIKSPFTDSWRAANVFEKLSDDLTTRAIARFLSIDKELGRTLEPSTSLLDRHSKAIKDKDEAISRNLREKLLAQSVRDGKAHVSVLKLI